MFFFDHLPVVPLRITSKFGPRNTGIKGATTNHKGVDLGRNKKLSQTPIYSVCSGLVVVNEFHKVRGWYIVIKHDKTYSTLYQHLKAQPMLPVGTRVKPGQQIGIMGNTSATLSIAEHLHFELWKNGTPIDPEPYLKEEPMTEAEIRNIIREELNGNNKPVSPWASQAWDKAKEEGLMDGTNPKGFVTREQLAAVIIRTKEGK